MTTRIGVVADTHCPEFVDRLPEALLEALRGVDLIVHAGDVNGPETLDTLRRIAPVEAVRGDHDPERLPLPASRELVVDGQRIVVVHGNRSRWIEEPQTLLWTLSLGYLRPHLHLPGVLRRRFPSADVIVFGHTHRALIDRAGGSLVFNPGGVHQWNPATTAARLRRDPGWFEWSWLQVARHIRRFETPSAGILEVSEGRVEPRIVRL
jgi:putative phosphoesterase